MADNEKDNKQEQPKDPDPILEEFPDIREAEKKQEEQRKKDQGNS